ncbi:DUF3000 family protein, partial [Streptomyces sp. NPDC051098]|uniref:DUF3000 family protein n=1 Tax=Streptomyces sp. NPDC051098 TaxID=3155411 RepID=UPI00341956D3
GEDDLADGRLVLLHDPAGHDAWQGTFRMVTLVRAGVPYADAALTAGCADQAHLAREMRDLGGTTLSAYAESAKNEIPQPSGSSTTA